MARRMFSTDVVNSDPFLEMPSSSQSLYFHLGLHCDDDGFVYPKKVIRMVGSNEDDLKILLSKKFILAFESGIVVVKHWRMNNYIRGDRYQPTSHREEMAQLSADNGNVYRLATSGIPSGSISREVGRKVSKKLPSTKKNAPMEDPSARSAQIRDEIRQKLQLKA